MKIPFNDFKRQYRTYQTELFSVIKRVLKSGYYILGKEVESFEHKFATYLNVKHVIGVANGLESLQISLLALGIGKGDEVITTSYSAVATTLAIVAVGAKPVFVDIDKYYHIDASKIEGKINAKTKAIIPVHLYGQSVDMDSIMSIANKHKLYVIEDCAQAHGTLYKGKKVGTFGIFACFSFYPTKNLGCVGDGGAITTNNKTLAERCRMIRNYGQKDRYSHKILGLNSRLDELQAAVLSVNLKYLDLNNSRRRHIASIYTNELANIEDIKLPLIRPDTEPVYHLFVIQTTKRNALQKFLKRENIDTIIHYPIPIHKQDCFIEHNKIFLPATENVSNQILSLPINPHMTNKEVMHVCKKIKSFYGI